jgi:2-phosphoglycerate kinase
MDRMRYTARNLEAKEKMESLANYKRVESSLLKNRYDFLIKAIDDYKKSGTVRPSVEKVISEYSKGLSRLQPQSGPTLDDILKTIPGWKK